MYKNMNQFLISNKYKQTKCADLESVEKKKLQPVVEI